MPILSMETLAHMDMAQEENQEEICEPVEKFREKEKEFLKDLYVFMKDRDTPIERIPNLGFKQIDLFLMFTTVRDLGGYQQVTSQQLWKTVYNMLGGNPRSTSAATCTRRHYEKLLLPYECHLKGISMSSLAQQPTKHFTFPSYSKDDNDGQRPAKRKFLSIPLLQNPNPLQPDRYGSSFPLPLHYSRYYPPNHAILPTMSSLPISSSVLTPNYPPAPQPHFSFDLYHPNPAERVKEPLEHLRYLAERYKSSSGLSEPLNLSVKARQETTSNPVSSFAPPSSNKNPKFLNKPSPLYTPHCPQVVRNERCETEDGEPGVGDTPRSSPDARKTYVIDVKAVSASSSPTYNSAPTQGAEEITTTTPQSSPKTDYTMPPKEREGSPEVKELDLRDILPRLPQENGGKMEIEIPLSVFQNWLMMYRPSATKHGDKQPRLPPTSEDTDLLPTNLSFRINPPHRSSAAEDLRLRHTDLPNLAPFSPTSGNSHNASPYTSYKSLPSSSIQKMNESYTSKPPNYWDAYKREPQTLPLPLRMDSHPLTVMQNLVTSKSHNEDAVEGPKQKSEASPSTVLMLDSGSTSLLHLTTEEVMKLKKIISSSL